MTCPSGKVEHATRDEALEAMKRLVYDNHVRGRDHLSAGLNVYPCDECSAWHFGHLPQSPTVYHYDVATCLTSIEAAGALMPAKPHRMPKSMRRKYTGALLALHAAMEEREPMVWFTWNSAWAFTGIPHPGVFVPRPMEEPPEARIREGVVRIGVPAYAAKLRWSDYLTLNRTAPLMRRAIGKLGSPGHWLATDQPVPSNAFRSLDVWYRDRWVDLAEVDEDFDAWLDSLKG